MQPKPELVAIAVDGCIRWSNRLGSAIFPYSSQTSSTHICQETPQDLSDDAADIKGRKQTCRCSRVERIRESRDEQIDVTDTI